MEYWGQILLASAIQMIAAIGMFLQIRSGQLNVGQAVFVGVGGYSSGLLAMDVGLPIPLAMALAIVFGFVFGAIFSALTLRLHHWFFAVTTLALSIAAHGSIGKVAFLGGPLGISGVPLLVSPVPILIMLVLAIATSLMIERSSLGLAVRAMGDDQLLSQMFGTGVRRLRVFMFAVGAAMGAGAGALNAHRFGVYQPSDMGVEASLMLFVFVIVGGKRSLWGPILGTLLLYVLPEAIDIDPRARMIVFGALLLLCGVAMPEGIVGLIQAGLRRLRHVRSMPVQNAT